MPPILSQQEQSFPIERKFGFLAQSDRDLSSEHATGAAAHQQFHRRWWNHFSLPLLSDPKKVNFYTGLDSRRSSETATTFSAVEIPDNWSSHAILTTQASPWRTRNPNFGRKCKFCRDPNAKTFLARPILVHKSKRADLGNFGDIFTQIISHHAFVKSSRN